MAKAKERYEVMFVWLPKEQPYAYYMRRADGTLGHRRDLGVACREGWNIASIGWSTWRVEGLGKDEVYFPAVLHRRYTKAK